MKHVGMDVEMGREICGSVDDVEFVASGTWSEGKREDVCVCGLCVTTTEYVCVCVCVSVRVC
jgi:hypothetical protein